MVTYEYSCIDLHSMWIQQGYLSTRHRQRTTKYDTEKVFLTVRSYARPTKMHIERNACSSECAWLARERRIYIICNHLKSWYEFPDSYTIYKHDLFIQIYVAAYAFGCVHTYIHINVYIWFFYQVCFVLKYLSLFAREAGVPQVFSRFFEWFIRAFVSAAVLTRAGAVFLWIASKYKVSTFLETIGSSALEVVASGPIDSIAMKIMNRLPSSKLVVHTAPRSDQL